MSVAHRDEYKWKIMKTVFFFSVCHLCCQENSNNRNEMKINDDEMANIEFSHSKWLIIFFNFSLFGLFFFTVIYDR